MLQFFDVLQDTAGNALFGGTVKVLNYPSGTNASIYNTNGTASPIATSTVASDVTGQVSFYIPDGAYTLQYSYQGTLYKTRSPVQLFDPMGFVASADAGVGANAYIVNGAQYPAIPYTGMKVEIKANFTNTGPSTLTVNGNTRNLTLQGGGALLAGIVQGNGLLRAEYDGVQFQLVGSVSQPFYATDADEAAALAIPALSFAITNFTFPKGDIRRYGAIGDSVNDDSIAINRAALVSPVVYIPSTPVQYGAVATAWGTKAPIYIRPPGYQGLPNSGTGQSLPYQNVIFLGQGRTSSSIQPLQASIADGLGVNAVFINEFANGKASWQNMRITSNVAAFTGLSIYADQSDPSGLVQSLFSGSIDNCWMDTGSTNSGFFKGGMDNYAVRNTTFEFQKGIFWFNGPGGCGDVFLGANALSNCYDYFVQKTDNITGNLLTVDGLHAYTHNRGQLFNITGTMASVKIRGVSLQAALPNLGTVGIGTFTNINDLELEQFSAYSNSIRTANATAGTTTTVLTDATASLGVNQYVGYLLYNATRNITQNITGNTATTITTAAIAGQVSGDLYQIIIPTDTFPVGLGQIDTGLVFASMRGVVANGKITCPNVGIVTQGAGALDLTLQDVDIHYSQTAHHRNLVGTGTPSGVVKVKDSDWSDALASIVLFSQVASFDYLMDNVRMMNAGLGGATSARINTAATSGTHQMTDCLLGQNNALAVAQYWLDMAGSGQANMTDCRFTALGGATAVQNPSATQLASLGWSQVPYSASMTFNAGIQEHFDIVATNGTAFTINAPLVPVFGKLIWLRIKNSSGGALGAITFNAAFKLSAFTAPANGNSRTVGFRYDGSNWIQVSPGGVDVPN